MEQMQQQYPEIAEQEKFRQQRARLQQRLAVAGHLRAARAQMAAGRIFAKQPPDALSELSALLEHQPGNPEARALLQEINQRWLQKARRETASWTRYKQLQRLEGLTARLHNPAPALREQQRQLRAAAARIATVKKQLQQADAAFDAGRLISPEQDNAHRFYHQVLEQDPRNRQAQKRLAEIRQRLGERLRRLIEEDRLTQARVLMEQMQTIYAQDEREPDDWLRPLEAELEQAIEARRPRIDRLVFSAMPLLSLDQPRPEVLQPGRTLYIGFHFRNMEDAPTLLQAVLLDGAGRVQIAQKPVILSASEGDHFFQLDLPVEGFSEGSYILEMRLENRLLLRRSFVIGNIHQP